ncbi:ribonuclease CAF1, partial [Aulographum hederae CBS 113979]
MDINKTAFAPHLLRILEDISEAYFVSIDLEMSGVAGRTFRPGSGKQTLQERYLETKEAAESYQILQVGITCVREDITNNVYVLKPYNFNLSPLISKDLDIDRKFSFSAGACDFLIRNGFKIDLPFTQGVPYLSRLEEEEELKLAMDRLDRDELEVSIDHITATDSLAFLERLRGIIRKWLPTSEPELIITSATMAIEGVETTADLSKYEKLLIHQLVKAEYNQKLVTRSWRKTAIRIYHYNELDAIENRRKVKRNVRQRCYEHTGFRWVVEALVGGSLKKLDPSWSARNPNTGETVYVDRDDYYFRMKRVEANLNIKRPVVVGHNCFTDMVYLYQCFLGELPDTVEEFQNLLGEQFLLVDTKYLATYNCNAINPSSSLQETEEALRGQKTPRLVTPKEHSRYLDEEAFHEAGYDSYLTARIMILLSAKLEAAGTYIDGVIATEEDVIEEPNGADI